MPTAVLRALRCAEGSCRIPCCGEVPRLSPFDGVVVVSVSLLTVYTNIAYSVIAGGPADPRTRCRLAATAPVPLLLAPLCSCGSSWPHPRSA